MQDAYSHPWDFIFKNSILSDHLIAFLLFLYVEEETHLTSHVCANSHTTVSSYL